MTVIFGCSGHAREIEYIIRSNKLVHAQASTVDFFITKDVSPSINGIPCIIEREFKGYVENANDVVDCYIGIGDGRIRDKIYSAFPQNNQLFYNNLFSEGFACDLINVEMGFANIFMNNSIVTTGVRIGNHNHVNIGATISHDCQIGDFNTIAPGARLAGNVRVGSFNFLGMNSSIIENVTIANNITIGAGAVVVNDLVESGVYIGVPAKRVK